ncbi:MAG TPA: class E sortase, partial [Candidatus Dormibacteraeota bacterium]
GAAAASYALIDFPQLSGIEGVAGNGTWSMLLQRSVVHYAASPAPGQAGNGLWALHREPNFEPLGTLKAGDTVVITNRSCQQFTYVITNIWTEYPSQVTQLRPISSGTWITVITCTPLWVDSQRLVIRAELQTS